MLGLVQMTTPIVQLSHLLRSVGLMELLASQSHTARCTLSHSFVIGQAETVWPSVIRLNGDVVVRLLRCSPIIAAMLGAGVFAQSFELGFESYETSFRNFEGGGHGAFRALSEFGSNQRRQFEAYQIQYIAI
jgi:hypothetical protein